jgi:hypothetical protein
MNHKRYAKELFKLIEGKGYTIECECEHEPITKDEVLKHEVDDATIYILDRDKIDIGCIEWTFWNDWDESISDYTSELDWILGLDGFIKRFTFNY